jgi:hypothetical protein
MGASTALGGELFGGFAKPLIAFSIQELDKYIVFDKKGA